MRRQDPGPAACDQESPAPRRRLVGGASPRCNAASEGHLQDAACRELARLGVTRRELHAAGALIEPLDSRRSSSASGHQGRRSQGRSPHLGCLKESRTGPSTAARPEAPAAHPDRRPVQAQTTHRRCPRRARGGVDEGDARLATTEGTFLARGCGGFTRARLSSPRQLLVAIVVPAAVRLISGQDAWSSGRLPARGPAQEERTPAREAGPRLPAHYPRPCRANAAGGGRLASATVQAHTTADFERSLRGSLVRIRKAGPRWPTPPDHPASAARPRLVCCGRG